MAGLTLISNCCHDLVESEIVWELVAIPYIKVQMQRLQ